MTLTCSSTNQGRAAMVYFNSIFKPARLMRPPHYSSMCLFLLLVPWSPSVTASALPTSFNSTEIDLGEAVTQILVGDYGEVFVGGTNFVAHLTHQLQLEVRLRIGPVEDAEHCWPQPAPCDNTVRVLQVDYDRRQLLVCGTAYQGTCTMHQMDYIIGYYFCVVGQVTNSSSPAAVAQQPSPGVLTAGQAGSAPAFTQALNDSADWLKEESGDIPGTVVLFLPKRKIQQTIKGDEIQDPCRSDSFAQLAFDQPDAHLKQPTKDPLALPEFASILLVAGTVDFPDNASSGVSRKDPLPVSVREMSLAGQQYAISYATGTSSETPKGFQLSASERARPYFFQDYKLAFSHGNFTYLVFLVRTNCTKGKPCVQTRVARICHDSPTLSPYVDIAISCKHEVRLNKYV